LLEALIKTMKLPNCHRQFPRDIGKDRPCLNYHMNTCAGWCQATRDQTAYRTIIEQTQQLLQGNYKSVTNEIRQQMLRAAEDMEFELAAGLRDRLKAVESLGQKQLVTAGTLADTDVVGYAETEIKACFAVLHFSGGNLLDKDYEVFPRPDDKQSAVSSLLKQYYLGRGFAPKRVLLPFVLEDSELFCQLLEQNYGRKSKIAIPQRGDNVRLVELANKNAYEEAQRLTDKDEKISGTLILLGKMLAMEPPGRIESYDISNISGTDIVASMVVFQDGKPAKSQYKKFKLEALTEQDDYASMRQILLRRFSHFKAGDKGFEDAPDLLLIDGGVTHACVAMEALQQLELDFPVFGMVKDNRHRTRALVTPQGQEIQIDNNPSIFALVGTIQEETHRFAISYHRNLRSKRLKYSQLDSIPGIGPKRKEQLLKQFKSLSAIREATLPELERYLPKDAARAVYEFYHS
jgi:excinuclease ABC subunit C